MPAGRALLIIGFASAAWACIGSFVSVRTPRGTPGSAGYIAHLHRKAAFGSSSRRALYVSSACIVLAAAALAHSLLTHDFSNAYVASYTSRSLSPMYRLAALWAGMQGSLLFWTAYMALYAGTATAWARSRELAEGATLVFGGLLLAFLVMLLGPSDPFAISPVIPADGAGLNSFLQSPFMAIHPILLYAGLTGFSVPFAFAISALVTGRLDVRWATATRRWTMVAWGFLTAGIVVGGAWAYHELGWGGYWAWDPVENASLLPWLTATAFLHSVLVQERRAMLKKWNLALVLLTFCLSIFGTFLTRSGLLTSVHTFAESPVGKYLLPVLAATVIGSMTLFAWRADRLKPAAHLESMLSREAGFLFNNLIFVTMAFAVFWGTIFPVVAEAIEGDKVSVGPSFFNKVMIPLGLALLLLTGAGPLLAWRRATAANLKRQFAFPMVASAASLAIWITLGVRGIGPVAAVGLAGFIAGAVGQEIGRGTGAYRRTRNLSWIHAFWGLVSRNRRRYGGYLVHLGVAIVAVGLAGSALSQEKIITLSPGENFSIGRYELVYQKTRSFRTEEKVVNLATFAVSRAGRPIGTLTPQRNLHIARAQSQSEIGLRIGLVEDLYLVITNIDANGKLVLRAFVNPLVAWIWMGAAVMIAGTAISLTAPVAMATAPAEGRAGQTAKRAPRRARKEEVVV